MERGRPDLTVYTFEVPEGQDMPYPDAELWTLDFQEADKFASDRGYMLMAMEWGEDVPVLEADYTPRPACAICGEEIEQNPASKLWRHLGDYDHEEFADHEPAIPAEVRES